MQAVRFNKKGIIVLTLKDIAAEVGVSTYTVSRVLNGMNKGVRRDALERAEKIIQIADKMGYQINNSARAVSTGKTNYIGLIRPLDTINTYLPVNLLNGISLELQRRNIYMQMMTLPSEQEIEAGVVPDYFRTRLVDGVLISYVNNVQSAFQRLVEHSKIPAIYINHKQEYDCIYQNEESAGFKATESLLKRGLRRIVYLRSGRPYSNHTHYSVIDRFEGYCKAMISAGLEPFLVEMPYGPIENPTAADSLEKILSLYKSVTPPEGFIVPWQPHAEMLCYVLAQTGKISAMSAINIITFSNLYNWAGMPLLSIIQPEEEIGRGAVDMLIRKIKNGNKTLEPVLVPYSSKMRCSPCFCASGKNGEIEI